MRLKDLCETERPREKMEAHGAEHLGTAELLAVLLRTGTGGRSALDLGHELMKAADGSLVRLSRLPREALRAIPGVGPAKALEVQAALELGWRMYSEAPGLPKRVITDGGQVAALMQPVLRGLTHEECWVLMLDSAHHVIRKERLSKGGLSDTTLDIRQVVRRALEVCATALILVHNHPSGNPRPGKADFNQTEALRNACSTMDLSLLDHVILGDGTFYSFVDERVRAIPEKEKHF